MAKLKEPRIFTLEEARNTLPFVKQIVADILATHTKLAKLDEDIQHTTDLKRRRNKLFEKDLCKQSLEDYKHELDLVGCHLKNLALGIVGYYWDRGDGIVVELCWKYGEGDIASWQEIGHDELIPLKKWLPQGDSQAPVA